jgi:uncharacterized membrane protein
MSQLNPYQASPSVPQVASEIRKVKVRTLSLFRRTFELIRDQYWLFLGITLLAMLLGSAVPFGLIMGNVLVGVYACYSQRDRHGRAEFSTMFKGFENFLEPFLAFLIIFAVAMVVMLPMMVAMFVLIVWPILQQASAAGPNAPPTLPPGMTLTIVTMYPLMIAANILITMPFLFTFPLMAERNLRAVEAVKLSIQGVLRNFWGVLWCLIVVTMISIAGALMCYFPLFLLMPLTFGVFFTLYRDIYGPPATGEPQPMILDAEVIDGASA